MATVFKWWPSLAHRKPQHLSKRRAEAANPEIVEGWFDKVEASSNPEFQIISGIVTKQGFIPQ